MAPERSGRGADAERVRALLDSYRAGEDPDLSRLTALLWELLYSVIPSLTESNDKNDQHRILEAYLVEIGLPPGPDLQYIAGPVLWYAREKHVVPPARSGEVPSERWTLDLQRFEDARRTLEEGRIAFGDWMTNALLAVLAEQQ